VKRGEVWWYEPPDAGRRPFLVLTRDVVVPLLHSVLAVPATTTIRGIPTEIELDETDGMPTRCVLSVDNLRPIERTFCTDRITTLSADRLREVCAALRIAVDC
jgi:mRNA interferase MazF